MPRSWPRRCAGRRMSKRGPRRTGCRLRQGEYLRCWSERAARAVSVAGRLARSWERAGRWTEAGLLLSLQPPCSGAGSAPAPPPQPQRALTGAVAGFLLALARAALAVGQGRARGAASAACGDVCLQVDAPGVGICPALGEGRRAAECRQQVAGPGACSATGWVSAARRADSQNLCAASRQLPVQLSKHASRPAPLLLAPPPACRCCRCRRRNGSSRALNTPGQLCMAASLLHHRRSTRGITHEMHVHMGEAVWQAAAAAAVTAADGTGGGHPPCCSGGGPAAEQCRHQEGTGKRQGLVLHVGDLAGWLTSREVGRWHRESCRGCWALGEWFCGHVGCRTAISMLEGGSGEARSKYHVGRAE